MFSLSLSLSLFLRRSLKTQLRLAGCFEFSAGAALVFTDVFRDFAATAARCIGIGLARALARVTQ